MSLDGAPTVLRGLLRGALQNGKEEELKPNSNSPPKHQPSTADSVADYYYRFKQFCSFYPLREQHLAEALVKALGKSSSSGARSFSILDVGSADGELLGQVVGLLRAALDINVHCVAVEPDPVAFARLEVTAALLRKPTRVTIDCIEANIEDVMAGRWPMPIDKFDCILCSHVFYHFKDWLGSIAHFLSWLTPEGCIVVVLDSYDSPIYQFRESLEAMLGQHAVRQEYGNLTSAEDFLEFLQSSGLSYSYKELDWKLILMPNRLIADLEDMLTFLYRLTVDGRRNVKQAIKKFAARFLWREVYIFPWKEGLFGITK